MAFALRISFFDGALLLCPTAPVYSDPHADNVPTPLREDLDAVTTDDALARNPGLCIIWGT